MSQMVAEEGKVFSSSDEKMENSINPYSSRKGGLRTMPFIIANEAFEKVSSYGLMPNMIFYLMTKYGYSSASGSSVLYAWSAISNSLAIAGAFLSDSYLGRYWVIVLGSFSSLLGMVLLWLTAMIPATRPTPCSLGAQNCESAHPGQLALLFFSFGLISIGAGCVRPCSLAFGADQLIKKDNPNNERILDSFFNWYYASIGISTVLALTVIVYIQDHLGWKVGFGVPAILMLCSATLFVFGSPLYVKVKSSNSLFVGFIQVPVAAFRNRNLPSPINDSGFLREQDSQHISPSQTLRCLNKACIIRNPETDLKPDGSSSNPWKLCTIDQVEILKSLLKVMPMWTTGIMVLVSMNQNSFAIFQANSMDRHLISSFKIPAGSFSVFTVGVLTIWVAFYDRVLVPILAKFTKNPRGIDNKVRMGIGLLLSIAAMVVAAIVEIIRRKRAIREGLENNPRAVMDMSAMWLLPQFGLFGLAEAFNAIGQVEFYYSHFPKTMSSVAMGLFTLGMAVASGIGSLLVNIVDSVTKRGGKQSWLSSNLNKGHYDYYYWLIAFLGAINFVYFLLICWAYSSSGEERPRVRDENGGLKEEERTSS